MKLVNEHGQGISGYGLYRRDTDLRDALEVQKGEMGELWAKNPTLADVRIYHYDVHSFMSLTAILAGLLQMP